jgi:hypothetical protein
LKLIYNLNWKYEFEIYKDGKRIIRFKIYDKTAERLTSKGVKDNSITDTFSKLTLTASHFNTYNRKLYFFISIKLLRILCSL